MRMAGRVMTMGISGALLGGLLAVPATAADVPPEEGWQRTGTGMSHSVAVAGNGDVVSTRSTMTGAVRVEYRDSTGALEWSARWRGADSRVHVAVAGRSVYLAGVADGPTWKDRVVIWRKLRRSDGSTQQTTRGSMPSFWRGPLVTGLAVGHHRVAVSLLVHGRPSGVGGYQSDGRVMAWRTNGRRAWFHDIRVLGTGRGGEDGAWGIATTRDGFAIIGDAKLKHAYVQAYSRRGDVRWTRTIKGSPGKVQQSEDITVVDDTIVMSGVTWTPGPPQVWLARYRDDGKQRWLRTPTELVAAPRITSTTHSTWSTLLALDPQTSQVHGFTLAGVHRGWAVVVEGPPGVVDGDGREIDGNGDVFATMTDWWPSGPRARTTFFDWS